MWPGDLEQKIHSRWDLLEQVAWWRRQDEAREQQREEARLLAQQQAEALSLLH